MFTKTIMVLSTALILGAASAAPAMSASSKARHVAAPAQSSTQFTRTDGRRHSSNPANDAYVNGRYAGSDPDSQIRADLARDPPWNRN